MSRKRGRGIIAFAPMIVLVAIIFIGVLFIPPIFSSLDESVNMTNQTYETEYEGIMGMMIGLSRIQLAVAVLAAFGVVILVLYILYSNYVKRS